MSRYLQAAAAVSLVITVASAVTLTAPGSAQETTGDEPSILLNSIQPGDVVITPDTAGTAQISSETAEPVAADVAVETVMPQPAVVRRASLTETVRATAHAEPDNSEMRCLATGVFFESKGEPLEGQLAVAHVIMNRARSGRFPATFCGVLAQRSQFSFVRGGVIPTAPNNAQWRTAVAIARIAMSDSWSSPVPGALFFHATRVSPSWGRPVVARLGNHIFYR